MTKPAFGGTDGYFRCACGARIVGPSPYCGDCTPGVPGTDLPYPGRIANWDDIVGAMADAEEWAELYPDEATEAIEDSIWESHRIIIEMEG